MELIGFESKQRIGQLLVHYGLLCCFGQLMEGSEMKYVRLVRDNETFDAAYYNKVKAALEPIIKEYSIYHRVDQLYIIEFCSQTLLDIVRRDEVILKRKQMRFSQELKDKKGRALWKHARYTWMIMFNGKMPLTMVEWIKMLRHITGWPLMKCKDLFDKRLFVKCNNDHWVLKGVKHD